MDKVKIAVFGCGFWSKFQIGGWFELQDAQVVALYNRTFSRAEERAREFNIKHYYDNAEQLLKNHPEIGVVDIITDVDTHEQFVTLAAKYEKDVICQKPMAPSLEAARRMMKVTQNAGVRYYIHENYRWQPQFRRIKAIMDAGTIGKPFRCKTYFLTAFPVFETQPFLASLEQFALTDQGSHQFDVLRFFFGEPESLYCVTQQVNPGIKGEDVATTVVKMRNGVTCVQEISFSSILQREVFPQTLLIIEGSAGSIRLDPDMAVHTTTKKGTSTETVPLKKYAWQTERLTNEPPSIVACNEDILNDLLGKGKAETTGNDNMKTVEMVFAAYESAKHNKVVRL